MATSILRAARALLAIVLASGPALPALGRDSLIVSMASAVERDEVERSISTLESFGTRYALSPEGDAAGDWIHAVLEGHGLEVSFETFSYGGDEMRNVVARHAGAVAPERVFVVGAHCDSTSSVPWTDAPGADDNASGVAAVLEAARVLSAHRFEHTLELILFDAEELGRRGSEANVAGAVAAGKDIAGMVNLDMIGYWPPGSDRELDIGKNIASAWLADVAEQAALDYATLPVHNWPDTGVCFDDHVSYWSGGFDAITLMDCYEAHADPSGSGESTPHYHQPTDTIATLDLDQTTEVVRAMLGTLAELAVPVIEPMTLYGLKGPGTDDVRLTWRGGAINYDVESCPLADFTSGVVSLTPPGGIVATEWVDAGVLGDGVLHYYRIGRH